MSEESEDLKPSEELPKLEGAVFHTTKEVEDFIEAWWAKHFHGLGNRIETGMYNHFHAAKESLKADLLKLHNLI